MSAPLNLALLMLAAGAARAEVIGHHQEATTVPSGSRLLVQFKTRYGSAWRHDKPSFSLRTAGLGGCPPVRSGFFCPSPPPDECTEDGQCPLGLLCCMDECHRQCTRPARPGRCPVDESEVDERVAVLRELIPCRPSAPEALECPTGLKCCEVAGNHVCLPPVAEAGSGVQQAAVVVEDELLSTKQGFCPPPSFVDELRPPCRGPARVNACDADDHCAGPKKCCPGLCSRQCAYPL